MVKKLIYKFLSINMEKKLLIVFLMMGIMPLGIISYNYYANYQREMEAHIKNVFEQTAYSYELVLGNLINSVETITEVPLYSGEMQNELEQGRELSLDSKQKIYFGLSFLDTSNLYKYIVMVFNVNGSLVFSSSGMENAYITRIEYEQWHKELETIHGTTGILPFENEKIGFFVAKIIKSTTNYENIGIMTIGVPEEEISQIGKEVNEVYNGEIVILNEFDEVVFCSNNFEETAWEQVKTYLADQTMEDEKEINFDEGDYIGYYKIQNKGKYKVLLYAKKADVFAEVYKSLQMLQLTFLIYAVVSIVLAVILSQNMTRPLRKLTNLIKEVQKGNMSVRFHVKYDDEIGVIGKNFNIMLDEMQKMLEDIIAVNNLKKQTEIDALKGQINPHFMYNTLETFRMMAINKEHYELADMIFLFSKMLRYNISTMNEMTTIDKELEYLNYYVSIMNYRYKNQYVLLVDIPEELKSYQIIKLIMQPIVENCIEHGYRGQKNGKKCILVKTYVEEGNCIIEISDEGVGISQESEETLKKMLSMKYSEKSSSSSIGLWNINQRVVLNYGENYGITINKKEGGGTKVVVKLPYMQ